MSRIRTNIITNRMANGAPTVSNGLVISGVTTTSDIKVGSNIILTTTGNGNFSGIVTATTFSGSGASLTNLNASNIASGTVPTARLGSGTANSSTFLAGDSTFKAVTVPGGGTGLDFNDNVYLTWGGGDFRFFHSGTHNYIRGNGSASLYIQNSASEEAIRCTSGGSVKIGYGGNFKLETTQTGAITTGIHTATSFSGDGSNLTGISAGAASYNAVINGEMLISQRGNDFSSVGSSAYHLDRWYWYDQNSSCRVRIRHSADSPDGFHQSYRVNVTTADTSIASNEEVKLFHKIEGQNLGAFAKGTSGAKKFTLSFYVKCNKNGTYIVRLYDRDNGRDVSGSYTVSNTNWNRYTIDFPADTTGEFGFDNGSSLEISFWLVAGSAVQTGSLNTTWRSSQDGGAAVGQVNFMDSTSNEWMLTGVQLEPTTTGTASDFKHEGLGETLSKCQRYYFAMCTDNYEILGTGHQYYSGNIFIPVYFPTTMRAEPTLEALAGGSGAYVYEKLFGNSPEYHHQISQETGKTGHNQSCIIMSGNNTRHGQTVRCAAHSFGSDTQRFVAFQAEL